MQPEQWLAHSTVATVIEQDGLFLMVEEGSENGPVFNQPAGHLEDNESLVDAALRETLEETAWQVNLQHILGIYMYRAPNNDVTYVRHCFTGQPLTHDPELALDEGIIAAHWLSPEEIFAPDFPARSPLVLKAIRDYQQGTRYPLDLIYYHSHLPL